jgi:hypothetical protein
MGLAGFRSMLPVRRCFDFRLRIAINSVEPSAYSAGIRRQTCVQRSSRRAINPSVSSAPPTLRLSGLG